ncbi:MAG: hypothetical protein JWM87_1533 [Candidatus Eremiobacteraeota bacterium]|nr:hypothetical protein [Candidatus Eremiobacteraeota bacterium]
MRQFARLSAAPRGLGSCKNAALRASAIELKTGYVVAASIALAALFFIPGVVYWWQVWHATGISPYRCIYGDPVCSLAVATYALCGITTGAFIAAFNAARWALRTHNIAAENLKLERSCILIERPITEEKEVPPETHYVHAMIVNGAIDLREPEAREQAPRGPFESQIFRFDSIGRAAIVDAEILLVVKLKSVADPIEEPVPIGSLAHDSTVYVRVWAETRTGDVVAIGWKERPGSEAKDGLSPGLLFRPQKQGPFIELVRYQLPLPKVGAGATERSEPEHEGDDAQRRGLDPDQRRPRVEPDEPTPLEIRPQAPRQEETLEPGEPIAPPPVELPVTAAAPAERTRHGEVVNAADALVSDGPLVSLPSVSTKPTGPPDAPTEGLSASLPLPEARMMEPAALEQADRSTSAADVDGTHPGDVTPPTPLEGSGRGSDDTRKQPGPNAE